MYIVRTRRLSMQFPRAGVCECFGILICRISASCHQRGRKAQTSSMLLLDFGLAMRSIGLVLHVGAGDRAHVQVELNIPKSFDEGSANSTAQLRAKSRRRKHRSSRSLKWGRVGVANRITTCVILVVSFAINLHQLSSSSRIQYSTTFHP